MNMLKSTLRPLPKWFLSAICLVVILWLTLSPRPLGQMLVELFDGADKGVHGIMFGALTLALCVDRWRQTGWKLPSPSFVLSATAGSVILGGVIEILQYSMDLGRSGDIIDFTADIIGSLLVAIIFIFLYCNGQHSK